MKTALLNPAPAQRTAPSPEDMPSLAQMLRIGLFSLAYFMAQVLAFKLPESFGLIAAIWPAAGIALASLLLSPRRLWPVLLGCLFAAGLAANLTTPRPLLVSAGLMSANICETAGSAWLITRLCGNHIRFARIREVLALTASAILINAASALIGAATASLALGSRFMTFYGTWWVADGLGLLLVTPLIMAWAYPLRMRTWLRQGRCIETACLFALGCATAWFSFGQDAAKVPVEIKPYLLYVLVVWAALSLGPRVTATLLSSLSVIVIGCTAAGIGPFPLGGEDAPQHLLAVQVFLGVLGLTGLALAAAAAQQRESHALLQAVVEGTSDAVFVKDRLGRYLLFNSAAARFVGKPAAEVLGKDDTYLFPPEEAETVMQTDRVCMASSSPSTVKEHVTSGAGEVLDFLATKGPILDETGEVTGLFGISRDITELMRIEAFRDINLKVLQILNETEGLHASIRRVLAFVKTQTGADAVGLRLQDGEDFPYFSQEGFSADFLLTENTLVERGPDGRVRRDWDGKVCLECTCGLVLSGKSDPSNPLFTNSGSFWTNDAFPLLDLTPEQDFRQHPRNYCIRQGYASMALIPVRDKNRIVGLLHLTASRKGCFTLAIVKVLEDLAAHIGEALMRKRVEETLRETQSILQAAMDQGPAGIAIADAPSGKLRYVNDAGLLIRGGTRESIVNGVGIDQYVASWQLLDLDGSPLNTDEVPLARAVLFGETCSREFIVRRTAGDDRIVLGNAAPIKDAGGRVVAGIVVFTDITERKQAEAEWLTKAEQNRIILKTAMDGFWLVDDQERLVEVNDAYCRMSGYSAQELLNMKMANLSVRPPGEITVNQKRIAAHGHGELFESRHRRKDGSLFDVEVSAQYQPESLRFVIFIRDITGRKHAEAERQKLDKLQSVGTLAGGIAHDFNNILLGLFGNISMAKEDLSQEHPAYASLEKAEKSMDRAGRLTKQLLTFAKGGAPFKEDVRLGALVEEVARFDLSGSNVKLVCRQSEGLWSAQADKGQLQQVVSNLVINARQAMPDGGHLTVTLENAELPDGAVPGLRPGRYVKITVQDEGAGIDPHVLGQIFDPYFTTKQTGSGLGLATVWSVINRHGGHIGVFSELGKGAAFTFYLPASEALHVEAQTPPAESPAPEPDRRPRILVMDDDETVCDLATCMLTRSGYSVASAPGGREAIELYRQALEAGEPFEAVIMDLTIPGGIGGVEALKAIREIDPHVRAIVSSGYSEDPVITNFADYGFQGAIAKTYVRSELSDAVGQVLKGEA